MSIGIGNKGEVHERLPVSIIDLDVGDIAYPDLAWTARYDVLDQVRPLLHPMS